MASKPDTLSFHSPDSLANVASELPEAEDREILWHDPEDDDSEFDYGPTEIDDYKAVYNPVNGDLYGVVSADYQIINPETFLEPLVEEIRERDRHDLEGFVNVYDDGARGYGEILFDTNAIWPPDRRRSDDPVRCGMTFRYSHDGGISVRASGFAQDGMCKNTMRQVTNAVYVKHAGDVGDRVDWSDEWSTVLSQLGAFSETLVSVIEEAMVFELFDLREHEFDDEWVDATNPQSAIEDVPAPTGVTDRQIRGLHGFYEYLGFPRYICLSAVDRLSWRLSQSDEPRVVTAWDAYQGATYAISHQDRFAAGSSADDDHHRTASDILANPAKALQDARQGYRETIRPDARDDEVFGIEATVGEAVASYEEREEALRTSMDAETND